MPRFNLYEQQTSAQTPRASGADFGAGVGQAVEQAGGTVADIAYRIQRREELQASDALRQELDTWAVPALDDFSKRQDINSPQAIGEFKSALDQKKQELLSKFGGSSESRASLERELGNQIYQYGKSAISTKIKAGQEVLARTVNQIFQEGTNNVFAAPQTMDDVISQNVFEVMHRKDAMSAEMFQSAMQIAQAGPIQAAVQAHVANGSWAEAEKIMADPRFSKLLSPDQARPLRIDVAVGSSKAQAEMKRQANNVVKFEQRLGRPLTPDEAMKARGLPPKKDMTASDEVAELELVQGKPATQDQVDKIFKTYIEGDKTGGFGNSIRGRSVSFVTDNAVAYANGNLTPDQARNFEAAYNEAYGPIKVTDPLTGQITMRDVSIPNFVKEAMNRGGSFYQGVSGGVVTPGAGGAREPAPGDTVQLDINGQPVGQGTVDASGRWSVPAPPESGAGAGQGSRGVPAPAPAGKTPAVDNSMSLYDNVPFVAGPTAKLGQAASNIPYIGGDMGLDQRYVTAQKAMDIGTEQLAQALRPNSRIADQYRQELTQLVNLKGKTWSNDKAMWLELQTIDKELRSRLSQLEKIASGATPSPMSDRQDALEISNAIKYSLQRLDVPQIRANTRDEVLKLPPGTRFLWRDDPKPQIRGQ